MQTLDSDQSTEHKTRVGKLRQFERRHLAKGHEVVDALRAELLDAAKTTGEAVDAHKIDNAARPFVDLIEGRAKEVWDVAFRFDAGQAQAVVDAAGVILEGQHAYYAAHTTRFASIVRAIAAFFAAFQTARKDARTDHDQKMAAIQAAFENASAALEEKLSAALDEIRRDHNIATLRERLPTALTVLGEIEANLRRVSDETLAQLAAFDAATRAFSASSFDDLSKMFGLSKDPPRPPTPPQDVAAAADEAAKGKAAPAKAAPAKGAKPAAAAPPQAEKAPPPPEPAASFRAVEDETVVTLGDGLVAFVVAPFCGARFDDIPSETLISDAVPSDPTGARAVETLRVGGDLVQKLVASLRRAALEHLRADSAAVEAAFVAEAAAAQEETMLILEGRLRRHAPRAGRVEMEVFEARDSELRQHAARFSRHMAQVSARAAAQRTEFGRAVEAFDGFGREFAAEQNAREAALQNATSGAALAAVKQNATRADRAFRDEAKGRAAKLEALAAAHCAFLKSQNEEFLKSLAPIDAGGSYAAEEIARFQSELTSFNEDVDARLDRARAAVAAHLAAAEEAARAALGGLTAALANVETDVSFGEVVERCALKALF